MSINTADTPNKKSTTSRRLWLRVLAPVLIGVVVVVWLFQREFTADTWSLIDFTPKVIGCIFLAWLCMVGRDFGLTWRFHELTGGELTWRQALKVDMLCEFTSCITPTAVGGSAFSMIYLNREGVALGKATMLMMTTLLLDEAFLVVACPLIVMFVPFADLFGFSTGGEAFTIGLKTVFWVVYGFLVAYTTILILGILVRPQAVGNFLCKVFSWRWLRRWSKSVDVMVGDMITTSAQLRNKGIRWWLRAFGATAVSWSSRFLMVNALFLGFVPAADQLVVFGRQFVIWVVLMAAPTPGGSGVSEWLFTEYYGDMIATGAAGLSIALVIALFWRILSYYVYLLIGVCLLPGFFSHKRKHNE